MNTFNSPVIYEEKFMADKGYDIEKEFNYYMDLEWDEFRKARKEIFFATVNASYTYGAGEFAMTYHPRRMDSSVSELGQLISEYLGLDETFELCFMNRYDNEHNALGWHADDADTIDHTRPIAVVSLGSERELWTKPVGGDNTTVEKFSLASGSLLIMKAGMQQTHLHRIPKAGRIVGPRISLTYRGYKA